MAALFEDTQGRIAGRPDVDREHGVGLDKSERSLSVVLVPLGAIRQAHRNKFGFMPGVAGAFDGELAQPSGGGRIDAAADAEHQSPSTARDQLVDEEPRSPVGLCRGIEPDCDRQVFGDVSLPSSRHGVRVVHRCTCPIGSG